MTFTNQFKTLASICALDIYVPNIGTRRISRMIDNFKKIKLHIFFFRNNPKNDPKVHLCI